MASTQVLRYCTALCLGHPSHALQKLLSRRAWVPHASSGPVLPLAAVQASTPSHLTGLLSPNSSWPTSSLAIKLRRKL